MWQTITTSNKDKKKAFNLGVDVDCLQVAIHLFWNDDDDMIHGFVHVE